MTLYELVMRSRSVVINYIIGIICIKTNKTTLEKAVTK